MGCCGPSGQPAAPITFTGIATDRDPDAPPRAPAPLPPPTDVTSCECRIAPGEQTLFCARHRRAKGARMVELCRTRADYFELGESQRTTMRLAGLGDRVAVGLHRLGLGGLGRAVAHLTGRPCRCEARRRWLNWLWRW